MAAAQTSCTLYTLFRIENPITGEATCVGFESAFGARCYSTTNVWPRMLDILQSPSTTAGSCRELNRRLESAAYRHLCDRHKDQAQRVVQEWEKMIIREASPDNEVAVPDPETAIRELFARHNSGGPSASYYFRYAARDFTELPSKIPRYRRFHHNTALLGKCAICHEGITQPAHTPCGHVFCRRCIVQWLRVNQTCPFDRRPLCTFQLQSILYSRKIPQCFKPQQEPDLVEVQRDATHRENDHAQQGIAGGMTKFSIGWAAVFAGWVAAYLIFL